MQGDLDERELRELIQKRFKGLLKSAKAKRSAPVEADLADVRRALAAMEAEQEGFAAQAQASVSKISDCQDATIRDKDPSSKQSLSQMPKPPCTDLADPSLAQYLINCAATNITTRLPRLTVIAQGVAHSCANTLEYAGMPPSRSA